MATLYQKIPMKNLIEKVKKWTCKARELMDKDVEVILLEQLKEEIASAREELLNDAYCSDGDKESHTCKGNNCSYVVGISKIALVLGDKNYDN